MEKGATPSYLGVTPFCLLQVFLNISVMSNRSTKNSTSLHIF